MKHLLSLIGGVITIAGVFSLITSKSARIWVKAHSYFVFIALIIAVTATFVIIDFLLNRKRRAATAHDRKMVGEVFKALPPNSQIIVWLKELFISKSVPIKYLSALDDVASRIRLNVVGLDNPQANQAYGRLKGAIEEFHSLANFNLFSNQDYTVMEKSPDWPWEQWKKASDQINAASIVLIKVYDDFLWICHRNQLD